eukprot:7184810-Pyramimonas_sp.AAC.1
MEHRVLFQAAQGTEHVGENIPVLHSAAFGPGGLTNQPTETAFLPRSELTGRHGRQGHIKQALLLRPRLPP